MKVILALMFSVISTVVFAKNPTMKLDCGKVKGYQTTAERQYLQSVGDIYNIDVTFITKRPDDKLADKVLRECIAASLKLDDKKDILASVWFRPIAGMKDSDDEKIHPYGGFKYISYTAKSKSVDVHDLVLKRK